MIKISGAMSITIPNKSKIITIIRIIIYGFDEIPISVSVTNAGTFNNANNQPKADEAAIKNRTIDNVLNERCKITPILFIGISRYTKKVIINAYKVPIAADSVAVKKPDKIPPIII